MDLGSGVTYVHADKVIGKEFIFSFQVQIFKHLLMFGLCKCPHGKDRENNQDKNEEFVHVCRW